MEYSLFFHGEISDTHNLQRNPSPEITDLITFFPDLFNHNPAPVSAADHIQQMIQFRIDLICFSDSPRHFLPNQLRIPATQTMHPDCDCLFNQAQFTCGIGVRSVLA